MKEIFRKSKAEKMIIEIRLNNEGDDFWCGYIEDFNKHIIQLRHFDNYGSDDGIIIIEIENIDNIEFDTDYTKTFNYITKLKNDFNNIEEVCEFKDSENWRFNYLKDSQDKKRIISLEFNQDYVIYGIIKELNENEFIIQGIGKHGQNEGNAIYKIENISSMNIMGKDSKFRLELFDWRMK